MNGRLFSKEAKIPWAAEWQNMPEYSIEDLTPKCQIVVSFYCDADVEEFGRLIGQKVQATCAKRQAGSISFPEQEIGHYANLRYVQGEGQ